MKPLKITLAVIVVAAIGAGIFFWIQHIIPPPPIAESEDQFTAKIEQEIEELKEKPDNKFCKDFYKVVAFNINDFYKQNRFGSNQSENDQWKENLEKNLYAAYTEKFIKQSKKVFSGSLWKSEDLQFIQAEKDELTGKKDMHGKKFLVANSPVYNEFTAIQTALDKYKEIVSFISACKNFGYSKTDLSARFPIADVQNKISRTERLLSSHLENEFVNNCTRLHDGLKEIQQSLFREHVRYLDNKINSWSGLYSNYNSQIDYSNNLYKPLKAEIEVLDNNIYNVSNFNSEYSRLLKKWSADNTTAYSYKYK